MTQMGQAPKSDTVIVPTVGRIVWFWPSWDYAAQIGMKVIEADQPMAASVAYVWTDRLVNLDVIDHIGKHHGISSVQLMQPGDADPVPGNNWCEWMPYQKGQAAKYEAQERMLRDMGPGQQQGMPLQQDMDQGQQQGQMVNENGAVVIGERE